MPDLKNRHLAALLTWLIPGLGQLYQGRTGKGILFLICVLGLYVAGFALGRYQNVFWIWVDPRLDPERFRFSYLAQVFVGLPALPALIQGTLVSLSDPEHPFTLMNGFMAPPSVETLNTLQLTHGRLVEIGTIYTMVAGLLNILAIYDALCGPAYTGLEEDHPPQGDAASPTTTQ
ncbi:hypothetical protein Isop_2972 [Isosphaera pallida ATCC 43644]|jgi:hypothetical protein|uniref:DUF6677 domain-containing protein n=1 Tax=Isosphaera pallida (strain ATCC 43644 / DSM 9630 / IS1B) TaxID=575540 RepID=E8R2A7_ISOPI|nr:DUF6677 family protein [Isosphaera pallida]ADV63537.1 hypothetical protein Isop_2972 [Isosphaera pallida ATCC 43644]